ncbi:MAG: hypothetical protein Fur0012_08410 [Elusimicrobiota bacterium]
MEKNDLPEINFQKKKERKGFLPWLRQRLGFGRSASMGELSSQGAINLGKIGASKPGIFALLAAKSATLVPLAIVAIAVGTTMYMRSSNNNSAQNPSSIGDASQAVKARGTDYVPAILREKSSGSTLDMFSQANKGKVSFDEQEPKAKEEKPADKQEASADENAGQQPGAEEVAAQLQGAAQIGLSGDVGGGNKFSALGGFGSKPGTFGGKVGFSNMGSGFTNLPKFQDKKNKLLAMNAKKFGVNKASGISTKKDYADKTLGRAQAIKNTMRSYKGSNSDTLRATADAAWEGTTGEGATGIGGEGIGNGGAGIVETPSSLNDVSSGGAGPGDYNYPNSTNYSIDNPWGNMLDQCLMYLMMAAALSFAGSWLVKMGKELLAKPDPTGATKVLAWAMIIAGWAMCIAALLMSMKVVMSGIELMTKYKQAKLGTIYLIGGMAGVAAAAAAMCGAAGVLTGFAALTSYFAGAAAIIGLLGSMAAGSAMKDYGKKSAECYQKGGTWDKEKGECK